MADLVNPFVQTATPIGMDEAKVSLLRYRESSTWDEEPLQRLLNERDRNLILQLPLSTREKKDTWMWCLDTKGDFTVKSGYNHISSSNRSPTNADNPTNWRQI